MQSSRQLFLLLSAALLLSVTYTTAQNLTANNIEFLHPTLGSNSDYTALFRADTQNDLTHLRLRMGDENTSNFEIGYNDYITGQWNSTFNFDGSGNLALKGQLLVNGVGVITNGGNDVYANIRVLRNTSPQYTDGMYIGYMGSGGPLRFFSNSGTTEFMTLSTSGKLGIGTTSPNAPLQLANTEANRKIVLFESGNDDHHFIGFGVNATALRYQVYDPAIDHVFHAGNNSGTSNELMRIKGNGSIGIGTSSPRGKFDVDGGGDIYLADDPEGTSGQSLFIPGHIYISPYAGSNISYLQARRASNTGTTSLRLRTYNNGSLTEAMHIEGNGNIGIGTTSPSYKLQVVGGTIALDEDQPLRGGGRWLISGNSTQVTVGTSNPDIGLRFDAGSPNRMFINGTTGNVGIATTSPDERLTVNGTIHGTRVKVDLTVPGPDYVFEKDYNLPSLEEIKNYIDENKRLPEVPSAKELEKNGIDVGEMNMILLKKVEELTLYVIEQQKQLNAQQKEIQDLKGQKK